MRWCIVLLAALLCGQVCGGGAVGLQYVNLDSFLLGSGQFASVDSNQGPLPANNSSVTVIPNAETNCDSLFECGRDFILSLLSLREPSISKAAVSQNELRVDVAKGTLTSLTLQYDGADGSASLNRTGMGGYYLGPSQDIEQAFHLQFAGEAVSSTSLTALFYDTLGGICSQKIEGLANSLLLSYQSFDGNWIIERGAMAAMSM